MPGPRDSDDVEREFDFGDPVLNDPDYETTVDAGDGDSNATAPTAADTGTVSAPQSPASDAQPATTPVAGSGEGGTGAAGAGADATRQQQRPIGGTRSDDKGNLVDAQGNIIAAAGAERRHYEKVQQQSRYITTLERDLSKATAAAEKITALNGMPQQLGLSANDTELALQFVSSFKKDPVATARWALQETMRMGYNLAQIVGADAKGQPVSGSMDLAAVKDMIQSAVAPLVGDRQAAQRQQEVAQASQREYEAFIAKHDHATVHDDTLANMLKGDPSLTPEVAYWQLHAYAASNGLDFTKPLRAQVLAQRQQGQQPVAPNGHAQPRPVQQYGQPMPNGSSPATAMQTDPDMAAPDDSWDSIVQSSLRQAGFN